MEVRCRSANFADGYGQWLDRASGQCFNTFSSVVVTVTDRCDCNYAGNYFSNKRWCCGDMHHMDLSIWAFEKLAQPKWGVIAVQSRTVPCWYKPRQAARVPSWTRVTPTPYWYRTPAGWSASKDRRPVPGSRRPRARPVWEDASYRYDGRKLKAMVGAQ
jgi:hypothetical protein